MKISLANQIKSWAKEIGFCEVGITDPNLSSHQSRFKNWLANGYQAEMDFMKNHQTKRLNPEELMEQTKSIICVAVDHKTCDSHNYIASSYVTKSDYHTVIRDKLHQLANKINSAVDDFKYRAFCDSAPVLEKALAEKAGIGWIGKYTCLLTKKNGSQIFLGELFTNLELPFDQPSENFCAGCSKCIDACPTKALKAPRTLDAKACIAYLTIEHPGSIPVNLRKLIGQNIAGCDICQTSCPWNKDIPKIPANYAETLIELFNWSEEQFLQNIKNTAIIRMSYERWLRNIAVALGNSPTNQKIVATLKCRLDYPSPIVREHVQWALKQHLEKQPVIVSLKM